MQKNKTKIFTQIQVFVKDLNLFQKLITINDNNFHFLMPLIQNIIFLYSTNSLIEPRYLLFYRNLF